MTKKLLAPLTSAASVLAFFVSAGTASASCVAGDIAGLWKFYGMSANASDDADPSNFTNTGSIIWCTIRLTNASSSPITYDVSGSCRTSGVTQPTATITIKAGSSFGETSACALTGTMQFVDSQLVTTLIDAKVDSSAGRKMHATGVAKTPNTTRRVNYTLFNLQR